jgi:putative hydrolase of the HAD superfamily
VEPGVVAERVSSALGLNVSFENFQEMWSSIFLPETIVPESMLAGLHKNYRLLLLSNTDSIHFHWVRARYAILRHFDGFLLSFELGLRKPEPAIYQEAISRASVGPAEIFFTDDRQDNVEGALQAGIDAVQFESLEKLQRDLEFRGVRW